MTDPYFLSELADPLPPVQTQVDLAGPEGHHAAVVRRLRVGERVVLTDGAGRGIRGPVSATAKSGITVTVHEHLYAPVPAVRYVVAQALAKGDRFDLALEMLTEIGVIEVLPWMAQRSVVRWSAERGDKSLTKWRATVREAAKQSRRLRVPAVAEPRRDLTSEVRAAELVLVLHEEADLPLRDVRLPTAGSVLVVVGPEGGVTPSELTAMTDAGAVAVTLGDGVLRTSTAGVVAVAALMLR
ncbi:MAG: 16S rRNA (uracil(1498)-N(3))-methyltransferase [Propionibacteriaceae bacterium]